ncbi:hypothetical protein GW17_00048731 [Ensete ventricosum]|nr:hypothetical protein GW17_00048731 [Ensete ventricosum]
MLPEEHRTPIRELFSFEKSRGLRSLESTSVAHKGSEIFNLQVWEARPRPFPTPHLYRSIARHDLVAPSTNSPSDITYSTLGVCNPPCFVSSDSDRGLYLIRRWCQARYASLVLLGTCDSYFSDFLFYSYLLPCCLGSAQDGLNMNLIGRSLSQCKRSHFRLPHCTIGSMANMWFYLLLLVSIRSIGGTQSDSTYLIGLGSYDITGPAADVNMMGYANTEQIASGVHFRLKARTFIVAEPGGNRVVFVNLDACMASQLVTIKVLERLKSRYSRLNYLKKVATLSSNLYGALFRELLDASINRSPSAYLNNPAAERSKFKYDVDKEMTLLKFVDDEWGPIGSFNCYPDEFESTRIIGDRQFTKAVELFDKASEQVKGTVDSRQTYIDFSKLEVTLFSSDGGQEVVKTCPAAMGFAFAAGTTDGPGAFDFKQGDDKVGYKELVIIISPLSLSLCGRTSDYRILMMVQGNPFWKLVRNLLKTPSKEQVACQQPKPILLDTGDMDLPYDWAVSFISTEYSTCNSSGADNSNRTGGHPLCTRSFLQWLGGACEMLLEQYLPVMAMANLIVMFTSLLLEFKKLASALLDGKIIESDLQPPDLLDKQISFLPPVVMDTTPYGVKFGDAGTDVPENSTFRPGDMVTATFWSACPRNDLLTEGTFSLVEILDGSSTWVPAYDDDDFSLRFKWSRPSRLSAHSHATIEWRIPETVAAGVYRLRHFGASKSLFGKIRHFTGTSRAFVVL